MDTDPDSRRVPGRTPLPPLPDFYYLSHFHAALDWLLQRDGDLLDRNERHFIDTFRRLPQSAQALAVRLFLRRGEWFRRSRLAYRELPDLDQAAAALAEAGWLDLDPLTPPEHFIDQLTLPELARHLGLHRGRRAERVQAWLETAPLPRPASAWPLPDDQLWHLTVRPMQRRLRRQFFGNGRQGWSAFVLEDLGVQRHVPVPLSAHSRPFATRQDLDLHHRLLELQLGLHDQTLSPDALLDPDLDWRQAPDWLQSRGRRLLFQAGQQAERLGDGPLALRCYARSGTRDARLRTLLLQERAGPDPALVEQWFEAWRQTPPGPLQRGLERVLIRARRLPARRRPPVPTELLELPGPVPGLSVEAVVARSLGGPEAGVHYVENLLFNGLFALVFWDLLYQPVAGAFFHPFQRQPADLYEDDFLRRRDTTLQSALDLLQSPDLLQQVRNRYRRFHGCQTGWVAWERLPWPLLEQALTVIPRTHLVALFRHLLEDLRARRSGFPDLIRLGPQPGDYELIEVKGPGDRLQDHQRDWFQLFLQAGLPARVCQVRWGPAP